jgi:hypothetical protein
MRTPAALTIVGLLIAATPAQADLALLPPDSSPASQEQPPPRRPAPPLLPPPRTSVPHHVSLGAPISMIRPPRQRAGSAPTSPLSFAVRQIVPSPIKVTYGRSANQAALVDWQGGRKWTRVLRDAVRPLGLHLKIHKANVLIDQ